MTIEGFEIKGSSGETEAVFSIRLLNTLITFLR